MKYKREAPSQLNDISKYMVPLKMSVVSVVMALLELVNRQL